MAVVDVGNAVPVAGAFSFEGEAAEFQQGGGLQVMQCGALSRPNSFSIALLSTMPEKEVCQGRQIGGNASFSLVETIKPAGGGGGATKVTPTGGLIVATTYVAQPIVFSTMRTWGLPPARRLFAA